MQIRPSRFLFLLHLFFFLATPALASSQDNAQVGSGQNLPSPTIPAGKGKADDIIAGQYIVKFKMPPLSVYQGGVPGLPPTSPSVRGQNKLDAADPDSISYLNYLQDRQADMLRSMEKTLGRGISVSHTFKAAFNGVAVKMSEAEARRVAKLPEVAAVIPDKMRQLHTDNGPQWIGADAIWGGTVSTASKGEGVVIGVIDTGINPANASFADIGGDGYNHTNPRGTGQYYGFCDATHPDYNVAFLCNDKLIGAYDLTRTLPTAAVLYDNNGHGSHTASTAAGNVINPAAIITPTGSINRTISGVAPHSNIISYKVCLSSGCLLSAILAAVDQAALDGVDVINYSIGGEAYDPWSDPDSEAFLNVRQAGIFVAVSAGNSGPGSTTVGSPGNSPWLLTVGNSSHNRSFVNTLTSLTRTGGPSLPDISGRGLTSALPATSIVYAGNYGNSLCAPGAFPPGTFSGQIVVCDRGIYARVDKGSSVLAGGAGGMVLANDAANGNSLVADAHFLPAVHITYTDGVALKAWLAGSSNHQAAISGTTVDENPDNGDIMTASSSRGVNSTVPGIIKPDVSAPGLDILAANGTNNATTWGMMTGTSMSSPHAAGAAALLLSLHPDWSPAEVQSALMSTADSTVRKEDGVTPADPFDTGTGRLNVSQAARAGFVLDETYADYLAADPALGGDPKSLNIPSLGRENIAGTTSWTRTLTATTGASWTATYNHPAGVTLSVNPESFTLAAGETQVVTITADASTAAFDTWLFGSVVFTPSGGGAVPAKFPVALKRVILPKSLRYAEVQKISNVIENIPGAMEITNLTVSTNGLTPATIYEANLYQDPTPSDPFDGNWAPDDPANKDGIWAQQITVPDGSKRLVTEIVAADAPDIDLYLYRWTGSTWEWLCTSAGPSNNEYCSISDPPAGDYYAWVQNWAASDPSGTTPDKVALAAAVVPGSSAGNLTVALADGGTSVPADQPFDLKLSWNLTGPPAHWYGRFGLGTDAGNPDNLGLVDLDIHVKPIITASAGANGSISPSGDVEVANGSDQGFTITPDPGYHIADVLVDGVSVGTVTSYTFTNVTEDHTIEASFSNTYTITTTVVGNGSIDPSGSVSVTPGSDQGFTIAPDAHYHVADVLVDGVSVGAVTSYTFTNVNAYHTISVTFAIDTNTIEASAGANGSISPSGSVSVDYGSNQGFTITPDANYHVADVLVDGVSVGAVTSYTFNNVTTAHTISASFAIDQHTITATAGLNGSISPSGPVSVNHDSNQGFTITPDANYHVADVLVDGASVGAVTSYTFTNVTAAHTIAASFAIEQFTLMVNRAGRGTVSSSPEGIDCGTDCSNAYDYGTEVTLTATPAGSAKFEGWRGDSDCADGTITVTGDISCTATFSGFPWIMFNNILSGASR